MRVSGADCQRRQAMVWLTTVSMCPTIPAHVTIKIQSSAFSGARRVNKSNQEKRC